MSLVAYTALGGVVFSFFVGSVAFKQGEKNERLIWQTANVETLASENKTLADYLKGKDDEIDTLQAADIAVGQEIGAQTERVIERIITVPVEKVVYIDAPPNCDPSDIDISYDTLRLLNAWSKGDRLSDTPAERPARDIPGLGAEEMSGDAAPNGYQ
jgi:hypothetical protein